MNVSSGTVLKPTLPCSARERPAIGLAYCGYVSTLIETYPDAVDFIETPYELLRHDPSVLELLKLKPLVLHCASLSLAGQVAPSEETIKSIAEHVQLTATPWLGEHLSFITAEQMNQNSPYDEYVPAEPYNIGYTVAPPMNSKTVDSVLSLLTNLSDRFSVPILLENPPLYFVPPQSAFGQVELINEIIRNSDAYLLLDLAHFLITSRTVGFNAEKTLLELPLDRLVEVHISGVSFEAGIYWDNHASRAPRDVIGLLRTVMDHSAPSAITLEYNWSSRLPISEVLREVDKVRKICECCVN